jgi:acetyltransferase-like isoleucine patch superfamily enzyme
MNSLLRKLFYYFNNPLKIAKKRGVIFGEKCNFHPLKLGSEPYMIKIGNNVKIAGNVQFINHDGGVHVLRNLYNDLQDIDLFGSIIIGNNVFIGANCTLMPGTTIKDNVVVGAGSLVRGVLSKNSIYAGVPARKITTIDEYKTKHSGNFIHTKYLSAKEKEKIIKDRLKDDLVFYK